MSRRLQPLVLAYHAVGSMPPREDPHRLFTSPKALFRHVARLRGYGYRLMTVSALADRVLSGEGKNCAALSFDDGFADELLPSLRRLGAPATVFAVSGWLGAEHPDVPGRRVMRPAELRALHDAGVEIGAHTVTHPDLTHLDDVVRADELAGSRRDLEAIVQQPVRAVAYPYGAADSSVAAAASRAGFDFGFRTQGAGSWVDAHELPRQTMLAACSTAGLRLKRANRYERALAHPVPLAILRGRLRLRGYRLPSR